MPADFDWDETKAADNLQKHGVDFADLFTVFEDPRAVSFPDPDPDEDRRVTIGFDALARLVQVVYTWRGDRVRGHIRPASHSP